jgi:Porin subfamily
MTLVKSLLLGSAAGFVTIAGAQAADLPVKAKPVQYVKICSLYGVGFYYIPGTDMCIKIGGWVRAEYGWGQNGNFAWGWANANVNNRTTNNSDFRARGYITADARNQTEYGTVRGYIAIGVSENEHGGDVAASNNFSANRAFIQWAGFTFGRAQSFFDFYSNPATSYWGAFPGSDTGDGGWFVMGYTAQFGNGFSATIAVEAPRKTVIADGFAATTAIVNNYGGFQAPDIVANLRVDQAWGSAQIMGALHDVNATYYAGSGASTVSLASGHPDDKVGWVIGGGLKLNTPWLLNWLGSGQGDFFQAQVNYTQGALRYVFQTAQPSWVINDSGNSAGFGLMTDAVYNGILTGTGATAATSLELTTAWNINAAYEHFWNPRWRTSLYGGYAQVSYGGAATSILCGFGSNGVVTNGCDADWQTWWIGSRTQWNITKDFYMGLDVMYSKLQSATASVSVTQGPLALAANGIGLVPGVVPRVDPDNWSFRFRVHRDFYP